MEGSRSLAFSLWALAVAPLLAQACAAEMPVTTDGCSVRVLRTQVTVTAARPSERVFAACTTDRSVAREPSGRMPCVLDVILPVAGDRTHCSDLVGVESTGLSTVEDDGFRREICRLTQLPASGPESPTEPGWFYDDFSPRVHLGNCPELVVTDSAWPPVGSELRFECLLELASAADGGC